VINTQWILASLTLFTAVHLSAQDCGKDSCRPSDLERLAEQSQVIATEGMKEDCKEGQICTSEIWKGTNPFQVDKGGGEFLGHKCTMFSVTENGPQGDLAKYAYQRISEREELPYFSDNNKDVNMVCPAFPKFSKEMKKYFWIYFFQVFADQETDCRAAYINNNAPNPPGLGLYTQDGKPKIRKEKYKGLQNEIAEAKALGKPKSDNKGAWENMGRIEAINQITSKIEGWGSACSPDKNLLSGRYNFLCTLQFIDVQMYTDGIADSPHQGPIYIIYLYRTFS